MSPSAIVFSMTLQRHQQTDSSRRPTFSVGRFRSRGQIRRGLAPLELVLWIPILLMVAALMVIYGTSASWRIRGEVASRDAVWRILTPRTGNNEHRPRTETWPHDDARYRFRYDSPELTVLDQASLQHEVARGPLPNGWEVNPILDPDEEGMIQGVTSIERPFPMLARMGSYSSGEIAHDILDRTWTIGWSYRRGVLEWPNEINGFRPSGRVPNEFRRSILLYKFPVVSNGKSQFSGAVNRAVSMSSLAGLRVLDRDEEIRHYTGGYRDFYPRARVLCTTDPEEAREDGLEQYVIDYLDGRGDVQLGGVTRLPRTLTNYFIQMYQRRIREIERIIEAEGDPDGSLAAEKAMLEAKLEQLRDYQDRLPQIEEDLRSTSSAR